MSTSPEHDIIAGLSEFTEKLETGVPIEATDVRRIETPDGPMHVSRPTVVLAPPIWAFVGHGSKLHRVVSSAWDDDQPGRGTGRVACGIGGDLEEPQDKASRGAPRCKACERLAADHGRQSRQGA
jgi:hypothetical protein